MKANRQTGYLQQQVDEKVAAGDVSKFVAQSGGDLFAGRGGDEVGWHEQSRGVDAQSDRPGYLRRGEQANIFELEGRFPALPLTAGVTGQFDGRGVAKKPLCR